MFPIIAAEEMQRINIKMLIESRSGFVEQIIPEINKRESPGRKNPMSKPVSAKTTKSSSARPPY